jgi:hypothetical protein
MSHTLSSSFDLKDEKVGIVAALLRVHLSQPRKQLWNLKNGANCSIIQVGHNTHSVYIIRTEPITLIIAKGVSFIVILKAAFRRFGKALFRHQDNGRRTEFAHKEIKAI